MRPWLSRLWKAPNSYEGLKMDIIIIKPDCVDEKFPEQPCGWRHDPKIDCLLCFMKVMEEREALDEE